MHRFLLVLGFVVLFSLPEVCFAQCEARSRRGAEIRIRIRERFQNRERRPLRRLRGILFGRDCG